MVKRLAMPDPSNSSSAETPPPGPPGRERSFATRVFLVVNIVLSVALLLALLYVTRRIWLLVFTGLLLSVFLRGLSDWLTAKTSLPAPWALATVVVGIAGLLALGGWLLAAPVSEQFEQLSRQLPRAIDQVRQELEKFEWLNFLTGSEAASQQVAGTGGKVISKVAQFFTSTVHVIVDVVLVLFVSIYLALAPEVYLEGFVRLFPQRKRERVLQICAELARVLRAWLVGQIVSMTVVGILIGIGLKLAGVPVPLALGFLAGLLDFIPFIGPVLAALPAVLLAFVSSPIQAVYVVVVFVAVNAIEGHLLIPVVQRYAVSLPPALTVVGLVLMGQLFGFLGLLLATPLAATLMVLVKKVYVEGVLGDHLE